MTFVGELEVEIIRGVDKGSYTCKSNKILVGQNNVVIESEGGGRWGSGMLVLLHPSERVSIVRKNHVVPV